MTAQNGGDRLALPVRVLRRAARELLHLVDRILHTARRAIARRRLRGLPDSASVLFICHGNICRSPYAEAALRRTELLRERDMSVGSAGFVGAGRPTPAEGLAVATRRGLDLTPHESRLMEMGELRSTDLIVVMDTRQRREVAARADRPRREILVLGDLDPRPIRRRTIRDPWSQDEAVFEAVYERIDRCVAELARELNRTSPDPAT